MQYSCAHFFDLSRLLIYDQVSCPVFSKHDLIFLCFNFNLHLEPYKPFYYHDFKNIDYHNLEYAANTIDCSHIYGIESVDNQVYFLENNILSLFHSFIPLKTVSATENRPWFNLFIQKCIDKCDLVYFRWKRFFKTLLKH